MAMYTNANITPTTTPPTDTIANWALVSKRKGPGQYGGDSQLVDDQSGSINDQAFAFENGHGAETGEMHAAENEPPEFVTA
jgi:hypothetical protein